MAEAQPEHDLPEFRARRRLRLWPARWRWRLSLIALIALVLFASAIWIGRERIAANLIDDALDDAGISASYEIASISPGQQVIENLVIGDPAAPDLVVDTVRVDIAYRLGSPRIARIELVRPRLYGQWRGGAVSFGALDPLVFGESDEPAGLPNQDIAIRDGRALIASEYGDIGIKIEGEGPLDGGFDGMIAATAPGFGRDGCRAQRATFFGTVATSAGEPRFSGPLRLRGLACEGAAASKLDIAADITLSDDFATLDADFRIDAEALEAPGVTLGVLGGTARMTLGLSTGPDGGLGNLALEHDLVGEDIAGQGIGAGDVLLAGTVRARDGFASGDWNARFSVQDTRIDRAGLAALSQWRRSADGTLAAPLLGKLEAALPRAVAGGTIAGDLTARTSESGVSMIVPEARLRSAGGESVLALSRISYTSRGQRLTGNFLTGGAGMPRINGRIQQVRGGDLVARIAMAEYRAGSDALAIPRLELRRDSRGRVTFNGQVRADGAIPGGQVSGLVLPLEGSWSQRAGLEIGRRCTQVRMERLVYGDLSLRGRAVTLCPALANGEAMLRYRDQLAIAVASDDLDLAGELAGTRAHITAARAVLGYPGDFRAEGLVAVLGDAGNQVRLTLDAIEGGFGSEFGGRFEGGTAGLDAVPLDLSHLSGLWRYRDGALAIDEAAFTLTERTGPGPDLADQARFEPMVTDSAQLRLADGIITATAPLDRLGQRVTDVAVRHDLSSGIGHAVLDVPGLRFGDRLQPEDLSYLAKGVIAAAEGEIEGEGRIDWNGSDVTSTGTFRSDSLDFAAAFGPVRGLSGEIVFTDLLGLTTAPGQRLTIGSVNPGVEALGGEVVFALTNGELIDIGSGRWPFMGGELILRPVTIDYGGAGGQSYVFEIVGLDAAQFVAQMELSNLSATGIFDGTIPIHFDEAGNGSIRGGLLISRPPGGNVAYVGELTYEDLGTMANFAFQTLRSLDYNQMQIELNGNLAGEIITNFTIDGVRQGEGAERNFLTRQLAQIPIRFAINVRSENFYLLATIVRGLFDPTVFGNPVDQGLLRVEDGRFVPGDRFVEPVPQPTEDPSTRAPVPGEPQRGDEPAVQPPESDEMP
ncbi:YdbH domain-containing protein [Qipengyuania nanhaisediminis]|uniref:intermembrane phospholipid transport protein YdbH family protein n=1 Tax=Qipengyuania nanhaisediminis TaxID=604088 RepID=UPI0038B37F40